MKLRYAYPLLFLVPSAMAAFLSAFVAAAVGAGILWIFVFGDNTWPPVANTVLMVAVVAVAVAILAGLLYLAHVVGKARETAGGMARGHVVLAVIISLVLPALVLLQQWQVGNLG